MTPQTEKTYERVTQGIIDALEAGVPAWRTPYMSMAHTNISSGRAYRGFNQLALTVSALAAAEEGKTYGNTWGTFKQMKEAAVKQARKDDRRIFEQTGKRGQTYYMEEILNPCPTCGDEGVVGSGIDGYDPVRQCPECHGQGLEPTHQLFNGGVRKGEKGTCVVLFKPCERKTGAKNDDGTDEKETYWLVRYYTVFNAAQCDGVPVSEETIDHGDCDERAACAQQMWDAWEDAPPLTPGKPAYSPLLDTISIPPMEKCLTVPDYYAMLFHEGIHATGHTDRLDRDGVMKSDGFGNEKYSKEELVAELGASFLLARCGMQQEMEEQNAAYCKSWLAAIKAEPKMLVSAANAASRGAEYIAPSETEETTEENGVAA